MIGGVCAAGAVVGAPEIAIQMETSDAVIGAAGVGTGCGCLLRIVGSSVATVACYVKSLSK
ncbi:MAG: hypothetical protein OXF02_00475 [Simkaniaceae bacterium]|nr:hypothetical protein [Simkaniaceae bacterium]